MTAPRSAEEWATWLDDQVTAHNKQDKPVLRRQILEGALANFAAQETAALIDANLALQAEITRLQQVVMPLCALHEERLGPGAVCPVCSTAQRVRELQANTSQEIATALDAARAEEREDVLLYVRQLAKNHPHLFEPYEHLAKNLEIGAHALRARGRP